MATKSETNFIGPKNHVARRRSLSRRRIVPVTLLLHTSARSVQPGLTPSRGWYSYCAAPRSHGVSEMKSWLPGKKRGGAQKGSERKQAKEKERSSYGKFSLSPTVYQRCIMLKTLQKITSDSEFTAYLVDEASF